MNERLEYLESLLSLVHEKKVSAVVAASLAGLIEPQEDSLGESAALFRLKWEVEVLRPENN